LKDEVGENIIPVTWWCLEVFTTHNSGRDTAAHAKPALMKVSVLLEERMGCLTAFCVLACATLFAMYI
jgi:hypothetical protein